MIHCRGTTGCYAFFKLDKEIQIVSTNQALSKLLSGRKVDSVRQRGTELDIDFEDGSTLSLVLAAAAKSVTLTNDDGKTEYSE